MQLVNVVIDIQTSFLNKTFTYVAIEGCEVGCLVSVPFGHQKKKAFIVELLEGDTEGLKKIESVLSKPYFDTESVEFAKYIKNEYMSPLASCIRLFLPPGAVSQNVKSVDEKYVLPGENFETFVPRQNSIKQKSVIDALKVGEVKLSDLSLEYGNVNSAVKALESKGVVKTELRRRYRDTSVKKIVDTNYKLTNDQQRAVESIKNNDFVLVDGVTGSGKTEIYLRVIESQLKAGKSAIVLVPEISLTPQTVARFRSRFGDTVAVLHSKMSTGERFDQWDLILQGQAKVVVGARSALFAPVKNLGIIVIDEEHETSYKQDSSPRYVTRDCAEWLAKRKSAKLVLGSATPSIEALYKSEKDPEWTRVFLPNRTNNKPMPKITVVDMGREFKQGSSDLFSKTLKDELKKTFNLGQKAVLLYNRRGFANYMFCRECGYIPKCPHCSTSLTYHARLNFDSYFKEMLACHHCGHLEHVKNKCLKCGSPYFAKLGAGTQSVEDQLSMLFPDVNIVRMDADTTRQKNGHLQCLEKFAKPGAAVLLGTQMIAKGLDFDDVTLVGVVLADTNLSMPDFRSEERTFNLISQVAGRAGRADLPGRVVVQTYNPDNLAIKCAAQYDRSMFINDQMKKRMLLNYPPFARLTNITLTGKNEEQVCKVCDELNSHIDKYAIAKELGLELSGSSSCVLGKLKDKYRYHILIKSPLNLNISAKLNGILSKFKIPSDLQMTIDVNPISLF